MLEVELLVSTTRKQEVVLGSVIEPSTNQLPSMPEPCWLMEVKVPIVFQVPPQKRAWLFCWTV